MADMYREIRRRRLDITDWLIHSTSAVNGNSAFENLLSIITDGAIRPGWAVRGVKRTIYGPYPAVCFTEQPLYAFCQYLDARAREYFSGYCIAVHKGYLYSQGGRPVIYGLENALTTDDDDRNLREDVLPTREQYRYVAFDPTRRIPLDWSHEREWRWAKKEEAFRNHYDGFPLIPFMTPPPPADIRCPVHIIVEREEEKGTIRTFIEKLADSIDYNAAMQSKAYSVMFKWQWYVYLYNDATFLSIEEIRARMNGNINELSRLEGWLEG